MQNVDRIEFASEFAGQHKIYVEVPARSRQDQFNKVWAGLESQGWKMSTVNIGRDVPMCRYRGSNGAKCAVGWLIPDDQYSRELEGYRPTDEFLLALQKAHDTVEFDNRTMQSNLSYVARTYGLTCPH